MQTRLLSTVLLKVEEHFKIKILPQINAAVFFYIVVVELLASKE